MRLLNTVQQFPPQMVEEKEEEPKEEKEWEKTDDKEEIDGHSLR